MYVSRLTVIMIISFMTGCANFGDRVSNVLFPATKNSFHTENESVTLSFHYKNANDVPLPELILDRVSGGGIPHSVDGGAIDKAAGFLIDKTQEFLKKESERYTASYSGQAIGDKFYDGWRANADVNLEHIDLKRSVSSGEAMVLKLKVLPTADGTAFRLKPVFLQIEKAKAKLAAFTLLDPLSWFSDSDNDLDLTVSVKMQALWRNEKGDMEFKDLGEGEFKINKVKLGKAYMNNVPGAEFIGKLFPMPIRSYIGKTVEPGQIQLIEKTTIGSLKLTGINHPKGLPAPSGYEWVNVTDRVNVFGFGNIVVSVLVTEFDDYGKKVKEIASKLENNKEEIIGSVTKFLGSSK
ncbi:MAG: hypothetical protein KC643_29580 [Nitrospira sp.]|nr:hypothetical protein [Nitrospira sp.]